MKSTWIELICDGCGCAEHFKPGSWKECAREFGWTLTAQGKHYCRKECKPCATDNNNKRKENSNDRT